MNDAGQTLQVNHQDGLMNGEASEGQNTQNTYNTGELPDPKQSTNTLSFLPQMLPE